MLNDSNSITEGDMKYSRFSNITPESRTFFQRTLGKIEAGALRAAIFTLISTLIGAGCLTLPLVFYKQGIILGILLMILSSLCSYVGIMNITTAAEDYKVYEYSGLVEKVLGIWWKRVFDNTMILAVLGTLIGYQVMVGFFLTSVFKSINFNFDEDFLRIIVMVAANLVIMMPLGLMRTLTSLRFMSIFSALTLTYIALLIICEFPFFVEHNEYEGNVNIFEVNLSVISSFNICMYAFNCHANVAQVYDELQRRNLRRMEKVATRALISVFFPFLALGIFGYLSTLDNTPTLIVMRRAPSHISNDWPMVIARALMSITLTIAVPINIPPGRRIIIKSWLKNHDEVPSLKIHCLVTIVLLEVTLLIAVVYPNILTIFSLLGGFCCGIIILVLPSKTYAGLLKIKTKGWNEKNWKAIIYKYGSILLFLIGTAGAILSFFGIS